MAPQAMVMNRAGNKKPEAATLLSPATAEKPVNAGISSEAASPVRPAPMMPTRARAIMP